MSIDTLEAERFSPLGDTPLMLVDLGARPARLSGGAIAVGLDRAGRLPPVEGARFDVLLTTAAGAPAPWVSIPDDRWEAAVARLSAGVARHPFASAIGARVLRITETMPFADALTVESLAYSTLLGGGEFRAWRQAQPERRTPAPPADPVAIERNGDHLRVRLDDPGARNAMSAAMRDALFDALAGALDDPTRPIVTLEGSGACFSTGGALAEFGQATDLAEAHSIRTLRSGAALLHRLGSRATARLHGAVIGSGLEIAAAAAHRTARAGAIFQLPELRLGLIPGAGGTVSIPRAIGRHRTAYLFLTGHRVGAETALAWGLVHAIDPASS